MYVVILITMASSWTEESNLGASSYSSNNYPDALVHYTNALDTLLNSSSGDAVEITEIEQKKQHQILLSNVIACRLKIGGEEMVERALVEAREVSCLCFMYISIYYLMQMP